MLRPIYEYYVIYGSDGFTVRTHPIHESDRDDNNNSVRPLCSGLYSPTSQLVYPTLRHTPTILRLICPAFGFGIILLLCIYYEFIVVIMNSLSHLFSRSPICFIITFMNSSFVIT